MRRERLAMGIRIAAIMVVAVLVAGRPGVAPVAAQAGQNATMGATGMEASGLPTPPDYVIGAGDVLSVGIYREQDPVDAVVRPDGKVSLPLINEVPVVGMTLPALRDQLAKQYEQFFTNPTVLLNVKEIHSRQVFIQGAIAKPGAYPLLQPMTVTQLIALAGGLTEFAKKKDIVLIRHSEKLPTGDPVSYRINYDEIMKRRNLSQDRLLKPGDQIIIPD
ncbi:MAG: polysaccharide biosynthesis/export family protein [Vicinamibacterales bacterium]